MRIDGHGADVDDDERVAVRRAACPSDGANVAASASTVLDNNGLAERRSQALAEPARADIGDATDAAGDEDEYGLARPTRALRLQRGGRRGEGTQRAGQSQDLPNVSEACHSLPVGGRHDSTVFPSQSKLLSRLNERALRSLGNRRIKYLNINC